MIDIFLEYESIPKIVEVVQFTDKNKNSVFNSLTGQFSYDWEGGKPIIKVTTIHGDIAIVRLGDWIIKEDKLGCYYPIKNDIFLKKYKKIGC